MKNILRPVLSYRLFLRSFPLMEEAYLGFLFFACTVIGICIGVFGEVWHRLSVMGFMFIVERLFGLPLSF